MMNVVPSLHLQEPFTIVCHSMKCLRFHRCLTQSISYYRKISRHIHQDFSPAEPRLNVPFDNDGPNNIRGFISPVGCVTQVPVDLTHFENVIHIRHIEQLCIRFAI